MNRIGSSVKRGGGMFEFQTFPLQRVEDERAAEEAKPVGNGKNVESDSSWWSREPHKGCVCFFPTVASFIS